MVIFEINCGTTQVWQLLKEHVFQVNISIMLFSNIVDPHISLPLLSHDCSTCISGRVFEYKCMFY